MAQQRLPMRKIHRELRRKGVTLQLIWEERVQSDFQTACMDPSGLPALARVRPDAALEILLAVCIEEPQHEQYGRSSMPETGIAHWDGADPPLYCRGP